MPKKIEYYRAVHEIFRNDAGKVISINYIGNIWVDKPYKGVVGNKFYKRVGTKKTGCRVREK